MTNQFFKTIAALAVILMIPQAEAFVSSVDMEVSMLPSQTGASTSTLRVPAQQQEDDYALTQNPAATPGENAWSSEETMKNVASSSYKILDMSFNGALEDLKTIETASSSRGIWGYLKYINSDYDYNRNLLGFNRVDRVDDDATSVGGGIVTGKGKNVLGAFAQGALTTKGFGVQGTLLFSHNREEGQRLDLWSGSVLARTGLISLTENEMISGYTGIRHLVADSRRITQFPVGAKLNSVSFVAGGTLKTGFSAELAFNDGNTKVIVGNRQITLGCEVDYILDRISIGASYKRIQGSNDNNANLYSIRGSFSF